MADTEHDKTPYLLWLDLETTGTDEDFDHIIEFAAILTDSATLEKVASIEAVVNPWAGDLAPGETVRSRVEQMGFGPAPEAVMEMHDANGLWDEATASGLSIIDMDAIMANWLREYHADAHRTAIAGSGVAHFDMRFINEQMPKLAKEVRYWQIDVGVLRRVDALWGGPGIATHNEDKPHRAMADAEIHLADARAWREYLLAGLNAEEPRS